MTTCEHHRDLINRAALLSEAVVRTYVQAAAAGTPRYGKALLKYGAAVGRLVQEATFLGGQTWARAAQACRITHLGLAALYLQARSAEEGCDVRLIQEAARLSHHLEQLSDTLGKLPFSGRTGIPEVRDRESAAAAEKAAPRATAESRPLDYRTDRHSGGGTADVR